MQGLHRQVGRMKKRTADESQVSVLLKDFEDADMLMAKVIDASKAWRDAWLSILTNQHNLINEFDGIYAPILGAGDSYQGHQPAETPDEIVLRTAKLKQEYHDLKSDMAEEAKAIDGRLIQPAMNAKDSLALMKKAIKKRDDRKLDYERHYGRVDSGQKKAKKSDRDHANLAKAEADLARAQDEYNAADENLRRTLPQLIAATYSLLPHLLANQIQLQNSFLAQTYTLLHNYCTEVNFPNPAPPLPEIVRTWEAEFGPLQRETESIAILAQGKAVRMPMRLEETNGTSNGFLRKASGQQSRPGRLPPSGTTQPQLQPSQSQLLLNDVNSAPSPCLKTKPRIAAPSPAPTDDSSTEYHTPSTSTPTASFSPAAPRADYFSRNRPQPTSMNSSSNLTNKPFAAASASGIAAAAVAAKKKPPPPPPRLPSASAPGPYVTALYDFDGQGGDDLSFREGDRIRVTKKSESKDDWWEGELRGVKGSFPANYYGGRRAAMMEEEEDEEDEEEEP